MPGEDPHPGDRGERHRGDGEVVAPVGMVGGESDGGGEGVAGHLREVGPDRTEYGPAEDDPLETVAPPGDETGHDHADGGQGEQDDDAVDDQRVQGKATE
jgi:hypothetical protein